MPLLDAVRWDERYRGDPAGVRARPRPIVVDNLELLPRTGTALDLAMGLGSNARLLVERGLTVYGIDISIEAARRAHHKTPALRAICADLTAFRLPEQHFDVILNLYYLQRDLFLNFKHIIRPGGIIIVETLMAAMLEIKPEMNPEFLLQPGELRDLFNGWEILHYSEGWALTDPHKSKSVASLVARYPA